VKGLRRDETTQDATTGMVMPLRDSVTSRTRASIDIVPASRTKKDYLRVLAWWPSSLMRATLVRRRKLLASHSRRVWSISVRREAALKLLEERLDQVSASYASKSGLVRGRGRRPIYAPGARAYCVSLARMEMPNVWPVPSRSWCNLTSVSLDRTRDTEDPSLFMRPN